MGGICPGTGSIHCGETMPAQGRAVRRATVVTTMALVAALVVGIPAAGAAEQRTETEISALMELKQHLTRVEQKQSMPFVVEKQLLADAGLRNTLPRFKTSLKPDAIAVDIQATDVTPALPAAIREAGGGVKYASTRPKTIRADLPLPGIDTIAGRDDVRMVKAASEATTAKADPSATLLEGDKAHGGDAARAGPRSPSAPDRH
jgi:hypothetical protein